MTPSKTTLSCPSAQPDMEDARVFGVVAGTLDEPRVAYLRVDALVEEDTIERLGVDPTHVFRFAARCEEGGCAQFDGQRCGLGRRIVEGLDPVADRLPPCQIRASCRWHAENGRSACVRCPQVVTLVPRGQGELSRVARLPATPD